jgi:hypothetical protein
VPSKQLPTWQLHWDLQRRFSEVNIIAREAEWVRVASIEISKQ